MWARCTTGCYSQPVAAQKQFACTYHIVIVWAACSPNFLFSDPPEGPRCDPVDNSQVDLTPLRAQGAIQSRILEWIMIFMMTMMIIMMSIIITMMMMMMIDDV